MKYSKLLTLISLSFCVVSCSSDDSAETPPDTNTQVLSSFIKKSYNVDDTPNTISDSINYLITDNKFISAVGIDFEDSEQRTIDYSYANNKISQIKYFTEGVLFDTESYNYNNTGSLEEFILEFTNTNTLAVSFQRQQFTHTADTVFGVVENSSDGIDYNSLIAQTKYVLDDNDNCTYYEIFRPSTNITSFEVFTYDANNNLITEVVSTGQSNGTFNTYTNNQTVNNSKNLFYTINVATYTRKTLMLLYQNSSINNINPKKLSPNSVQTFNTTFGDNTDFDIINTVNEDNFTTFSDYKFFLNDELFSRFTEEFFFIDNP